MIKNDEFSSRLGEFLHAGHQLETVIYLDKRFVFLPITVVVVILLQFLSEVLQLLG